MYGKSQQGDSFHYAFERALNELSPPNLLTTTDSPVPHFSKIAFPELFSLIASLVIDEDKELEYSCDVLDEQKLKAHYMRKLSLSTQHISERV